MKRLTNPEAALVASVVALTVLLLCWFVWWSKPPQMGTDKEGIKAVDALFTAVTARDENLITQCQQRLHAHKDAGKLPHNASNYLDGIIRKARTGQWETAAEQLYEFMTAQRRP